MVEVAAPFFTRLYVSYLALRYLPASRTAWGWTILTNYLFRSVIVGLEDYSWNAKTTKR